jgi:hypothetical protein
VACGFVEGGAAVVESWQDQGGTTRWADFCDRMTVRRVSPAELPVPSARSSPHFVARLAEFRGRLLPGDELYYYNSYPEDWDRLLGSEGYAIVRDGEVLDTLVTKLN